MTSTYHGRDICKPHEHSAFCSGLPEERSMELPRHEVNQNILAARMIRPVDLLQDM